MACVTAYCSKKEFKVFLKPLAENLEYLVAITSDKDRIYALHYTDSKKIEFIVKHVDSEKESCVGCANWSEKWKNDFGLRIVLLSSKTSFWSTLEHYWKADYIFLIDNWSYSSFHIVCSIADCRRKLNYTPKILIFCITLFAIVMLFIQSNTLNDYYAGNIFAISKSIQLS
jgi:hypothetical protein